MSCAKNRALVKVLANYHQSYGQAINLSARKANGWMSGYIERTSIGDVAERGLEVGRWIIRRRNSHRLHRRRRHHQDVSLLQGFIVCGSKRSTQILRFRIIDSAGLFADITAQHRHRFHSGGIVIRFLFARRAVELSQGYRMMSAPVPTGSVAKHHLHSRAFQCNPVPYVNAVAVQRYRDFIYDCSAVSEPSGGRFHRLIDRGLGHLFPSETLAHDGDLESRQSFIQCFGVASGLYIDLPRIESVRPGCHFEQKSAVGYGASHWSRVIESRLD